jgi:hypothetical protein
MIAHANHGTLERIAYWLSMFAERLNRQNSPEMVREYANALHDLTPEEVDRAGAELYRRETFIPPPGRFRELARPVAIDVERLCDAIAFLGTHNPCVGMLYPRASVVRDVLGDAIGAAYAFAGAAMVFSDNDVSRENARRQFAAELRNAPAKVLEPWLIGGKTPRLSPPKQSLPALPPAPGEWGESPRALIESVAESRSEWREKFRKAGALRPEKPEPNTQDSTPETAP